MGWEGKGLLGKGWVSRSRYKIPYKVYNKQIEFKYYKILFYIWFRTMGWGPFEGNSNIPMERGQFLLYRLVPQGGTPSLFTVRFICRKTIALVFFYYFTILLYPSQSSIVDLNHWTHLLDIWMNRMIDFRKQKILQSLQFFSLSNKDIEERRSNYWLSLPKQQSAGTWLD